MDGPIRRGVAGWFAPILSTKYPYALLDCVVVTNPILWHFSCENIVPRLSFEATASLQKSRDAALLAVETYNRPGTVFRSGGYIVLMVIAWTSLLHAGFFKRKVKPYYRKKGSKRFEKVDGDYKAWELAECVAQFFKEKNPPERKNLELFIGLRNKIEHRSLP